MANERITIFPGLSVSYAEAAKVETVQLAAIKVAGQIANKYQQAPLTAEYLGGEDSCVRFRTYALLAGNNVPILAQLFSAHVLKCPDLSQHVNTVISFAQVIINPPK